MNMKAYASDTEVKWCPGCGDFAVLKAIQKMLAECQIANENAVFVSGIGCSGRLPYYLKTYGLHTLHGRAPAFATGVKLANPDLSVFVVTGDGDGLSIGSNHLLHLCRRNVDVTVILLNNRVYGLTKGQYSPTSLQGQKSITSLDGVKEKPACPTQFALTAGASFVGRAIDIDQKHMLSVLIAASKHKGTSFVEIFQNCHIFNDKTFADFADPEHRDDRVIYVDETEPSSRTMKLLLSHEYPVPVGIFRS